MNIYLNVEISSRELDSKLLLATLGASRGHQVIVSDMSGIDRGIRKKLLAPGIFHTKCITPFEAKIKFHQELIDQGYIITSIDEEAGLDMSDYEEFSKTRYSEKTFEQSSAIFTWGNDDMNFLKKFYPKHQEKMHKTGSPRIDLSRSSLQDYWMAPKSLPKKPYLLISSNMGKGNYIKPFHEIIRENKKIGYYNRDQKLFRSDFGCASEDYLKIYNFIEAIKYLSKNSNGFEIVFRPHPIENIESWKLYLDGIPNVYVIRDGSITPWINNSFALMHCGCTSAIEATVAGKPVVSFVPFQMNYTTTFTNKLDYCVNNLKDLSSTINNIFDRRKSISNQRLTNTSSEVLSKKIYLDNDELAAAKIIKIWESLDNLKLSKASSWGTYKWLLWTTQFVHMFGISLRKLFPNKFGHFREDFKFAPLDKDDIEEKVRRLQKNLGIKKKIDCKLLSKRTILIKSD